MLIFEGKVSWGTPGGWTSSERPQGRFVLFCDMRKVAVDGRVSCSSRLPPADLPEASDPPPPASIPSFMRERE